MKKLLLLFAITLLIQFYAHSQKTSIGINNRYTENSLFLFNSFQDGKAYFKDGGVSKGKFNYNVVYNKICYIDNNQIFEMSDVSRLDSLQINNFTLIINHKNIFELIKPGKVSLLLQRTATLPSSTPEGAYGTPSNTSAVSKKTSLYNSNGALVGERVNVQNDSDAKIPISNKYFFLIDNEIIQASKHKISKYFENNKSEIKNFLKESSLNLNNEADLIKLTSFLEQLD